ncbi:hypothetical protein BH10ACT11_BH10ACT11_21440 [soil metagenome]
MVRVDGKVLAEAVHKHRPSENGQTYRRMKYVIEYERPGAGSERVEILETERFGSKVMASLSRGATAPLLVDSKSGKVRFDTDDPRINLKARIGRTKRRGDDEFERALRDGVDDVDGEDD